MLEFDAETSAILDRAYRGRDFVRRRHANLAALAPAPGAYVLDIGCGTGLMLTELSAAVGPKGHVAGVDLSEDMLTRAREACSDLDNVTVKTAPADQLPFEDASFDGIVSVQVFEYIADLTPVLAECRRVLKPGGTLVVGDMHFDTLAWHSDNPSRMAAMERAWDGHFADRMVPARLPGMLTDAGFRHTDSRDVTFIDTEFRPDGLARMMSILMPAFARSQGSMTEAEIADWEAEQAALAKSGRFFFCLSHIITVAAAV